MHTGCVPCFVVIACGPCGCLSWAALAADSDAPAVAVHLAAAGCCKRGQWAIRAPWKQSSQCDQEKRQMRHARHDQRKAGLQGARSVPAVWMPVGDGHPRADGSGAAAASTVAPIIRAHLRHECRQRRRRQRRRLHMDRAARHHSFRRGPTLAIECFAGGGGDDGGGGGGGGDNRHAALICAEREQRTAGARSGLLSYCARRPRA